MSGAGSGRWAVLASVLAVVLVSGVLASPTAVAGPASPPVAAGQSDAGTRSGHRPGQYLVSDDAGVLPEASD